MAIVAENNTNFISALAPTSNGIDATQIELAKETLASTPLPTTRTEAWKYTRVAKLGKIDFKNEASEINSLSEYVIDENALQIVFVNGHLSSKLSSVLPEGLTIESIENATNIPSTELKVEGEIFNALNTAYLTGGLVISIAPKAIIEKTIQVTHILKGNEMISNFRTIINCGAFAKANVIQGFFAEDADNSFGNHITEVVVGENAFLTIDKVQYEAENTFNITTEQVEQAKDSTFTINTITLNGGLVRNNLNINVNGENCTTNLNGAYLLKEKQHVDNHSIVDHRVANCESNELYKGVMDDKSTAVFNGKVFVRKDAQKINAFQSNGNVLLSDDATVNSKPELEIYADDVKCSHGSTTGQLDEEAVFYLRARGLSERSARQLMVSAFVGDVLEKIENENVHNFIGRLLEKRFGWIID